jgi:hypothetical protein
VPPEPLPDPDAPVGFPPLPLTPIAPELPPDDEESEPVDEQPNPSKTTDEIANHEGRRNRMGNWSLGNP